MESSGGDNNNYTKKIIAETIENFIPDVKIEYHNDDVDPRNYKVNFQKVRDYFGFEPKFDLSYGINELINLFNDKNFIFQDNPKNKNLYGNYNLDHIIK